MALSDIEIARRANKKPIKEIAKKLMLMKNHFIHLGILLQKYL